MKKILFTIMAVFAIGLVAVTSGCGNSATNEKTEKAEEQVEAVIPEPTAVTTSKGTYDVKMVMQRMYKSGVSLGKDKKSQHVKSPSKYPKEELLKSAESNFKKDWSTYTEHQITTKQRLYTIRHFSSIYKAGRTAGISNVINQKY